MGLFSIITPSFRPGPWIRLCIASVADQAGVAKEHIVHDAGSDDGTLDWLTEDRRVLLDVEQDTGMYDAINRGLKRSRGDLLAYLNADEQYLPGALHRVARFFENNPQVDVIFGDVVLIDAEARLLSYRRAVLPRRGHVRWVHLNTLSCAMFFRRSVVERGYCFDGRWRAIGDAVWVERLLASGIEMAVIPEPLAAFAFTGKNLGATEQAARELDKWQGDAWQVRFRALYSMIHRFEKWRAGAYRTRDIEVLLYTRASPSTRTLLAGRIGYTWPSGKDEYGPSV